MNYKPPKLRDHGGDITKRWAIYWSIFDEETRKWERKVSWLSSTINDRKGLYLEADKVIKSVTESLKKGIKISTQQKKQGVGVIEAINRSVEFKKQYLSPRTNQSYSNIANKLIKWVKRKNSSMLLEEFSKYEANQFISESFGHKRYEPKTINCSVSYLHSIFAHIGNLYPIPDNPFELRKIKENEPNVDIWTKEEMNTIADYLKKNSSELFVILLLIYHVFLRPNEIRQLQIKDINITKGTIKISSKVGKSNHVKHPTISKQLLEILTPITLNNSPDMFLFSRLFKPGKFPIK